MLINCENRDTSGLRSIRWLIVGLLSMMTAAAPLHAQPTAPMITADTAAQLIEIRRMGSGAVQSLVWSADGATLAVVTTLGVWISDGDAEPILLSGQGGAATAAFSPDGRQIATGGADGSVLLWDLAEPHEPIPLTAHLYAPGRLAFSPDGSLFASSDPSGYTHVWSVESSALLVSLATQTYQQALAFSRDGARLASADDTRVYVWDLQTEAADRLVAEADSTGRYVELAFAADDRTPVIGAGASTDRAAWTADRARLATWTPSDGTVTIQATASGGDPREDTVALTDAFVGAGGVGFSNGILAVYADNLARRWNIETGAYLSTISTRTTPPGSATVPPRDWFYTSPDGALIARFGVDGIIRLIDTTTDAEIARFFGHLREVTSAAFTPDGSLLASASLDGTIRLWAVPDLAAARATPVEAAALAVLTGHNGGVTGVDFSRDGSLLASSGFDGTIRLWAVDPRAGGG
ncbi:MAG: hypothetical protein GYB67_01270 [Chloroflexi bacterium]|nr:hypothetical protein [Chloroflexota bacterium]